MACENTEDRAVAAGHSVDPAQWRGLLDAGLARVAGRFARVEPLGTAPAPAFLFLRRPRTRILGPPLEAINTAPQDAAVSPPVAAQARCRLGASDLAEQATPPLG